MVPTTNTLALSRSMFDVKGKATGAKPPIGSFENCTKCEHAVYSCMLLSRFLIDYSVLTFQRRATLSQQNPPSRMVVPPMRQSIWGRSVQEARCPRGNGRLQNSSARSSISKTKHSLHWHPCVLRYDFSDMQHGILTFSNKYASSSATTLRMVEALR